MDVRDEVGPWTEIKLEIIRKYAKAYSTILSSANLNKHIYIDAFAGAGECISRESGEILKGSPCQVLEVDPPFTEYYFVELDPEKNQFLQQTVGSHDDVHFYEGDCNEVLLQKIFPEARYGDYNRALCLLDPYNLNVNWEVIRKAGEMGSIEIFLNFQIHDANRNVLWSNPEEAKQKQIDRMDSFWGDSSWRDVAYRSEKTLFGQQEKKRDVKNIVSAFRDKLESGAGFDYVPEPTLFSNSTNAPLYYLFFASQEPVAKNIVQDIFDDYRHELRNL